MAKIKVEITIRNVDGWDVNWRSPSEKEACLRELEKDIKHSLDRAYVADLADTEVDAKFETEKYTNMRKKFLTVDEAVAHLNAIGFSIKKSWIYERTRNSEIPFVKVAGRIYFENDEFIKWIKTTLSPNFTAKKERSIV